MYQGYVESQEKIEARKQRILKAIKKQAGRKGGLATVAKHGIEHMQEIGRRGAVVTHSRYSIKPVNESQYAMVHRATNKIISIW